MTQLNLLGDGQRCECADPGCKAHKGTSDCNHAARWILYRVDMQDETGTAFCDACSDDAFSSGLFTDEDPNEADWQEEEEEEAGEAGQALTPVVAILTLFVVAAVLVCQSGLLQAVLARLSEVSR